MRRTAALLVMVFLASACGGEETTDAPRELVCDVELAEIESAIRSGLPTYDYNPKLDAAELVADADLIITGELTSVDRIDDGVEDQLTFFATSDGAVFTMDSRWADRNAGDPLAGGLTLHDVAFVAFLHKGAAGNGA